MCVTTHTALKEYADKKIQNLPYDQISLHLRTLLIFVPSSASTKYMLMPGMNRIQVFVYGI